MAKIAEILKSEGIASVNGDLVEVILVGNPWNKITENRPLPPKAPPFPPEFLATFPEFPTEPWYRVPASPQKEFWVHALGRLGPQVFDLSSFVLRNAPKESDWDPKEGPMIVPDKLEKAIIHDALRQFSDSGFEIFAFACDLRAFSDKELTKLLEKALRRRRQEKTPTKASSKMHYQQRHYTGQKLAFEPHRALHWLNLLRAVSTGKEPQKNIAITRPSRKQQPKAYAQISATGREIGRAKKIISWFSGECDAPNFTGDSK